MVLSIMDNEQWRVVTEFPDYEVSSEGVVRRRIAGATYPAGKVIKGHLTPEGHRRVGLYRDGKPLNQSVHRLVCSAFHGPPPTAKHEAAHWDGNPVNNTPGNLRWATRQENADDMVRHGTQARGDRSGRHTKPERTARGEHAGSAVLKADDVIAIFTAPWVHGEGARLARLYNVCKGSIGSIRRSEKWLSVTAPIANFEHPL